MPGQNTSTEPAAFPPYNGGTFSWPIPWQYSIDGGVGWTAFTTASHAASVPQNNTPEIGPISKHESAIPELTLLSQFSASDLNTPNGGSGDTLISDLNKSVTDATPLFAPTG